MMQQLRVVSFLLVLLPIAALRDQVDLCLCGTHVYVYVFVLPIAVYGTPHLRDQIAQVFH